MFAQLAVQVVGGGSTFGMTLACCLKVVLERLKTLVELLEVSLELMLAAVSDGQHQNGKIVEYR